MFINLTAPINDRSYGLCGLNLTKSLVELGHEVALFIIGQPLLTNQKDTEVIAQCYLNQERYDSNAASVRLWHQFDLAQHVGRGIRAGFPIFELDDFNEREKWHLSQQDILLCCSNWAKKILQKYVDREIFVVPLGVDKSIFNINNSSLNEHVDQNADYDSNRGVVRFLNIGKIEYRKGHDILVNAFCDAFEPTDNVQLFMSWSNPFLSDEETAEWTKLYKESKLGEKIIFLPWLPDQSNLVKLIGKVNCGIFPSRAEGWNLPALEMLACGKSVIATDYGGHTEFLDSENAELVEIDELEDAFDGKWFFGQGKWAQIGDRQYAQLVYHMRQVYNKYRQNPKHINQKGVETADKFSWQNSAEKLVEAIS